MAKPRTIYWDACAWIAYINREMPTADTIFKEPRFEMCRDTLRRAEAGDYQIATSAFTLAEVCKPLDPSSPGNRLSAYFDQPHVMVIPVDKQVGLQAQTLMQGGHARLRPPDAIHLASALVWSVPVFHTFDGPLKALNTILTMANGDQLGIMMPTEEVPTPDLLKAMQDGGRKDPTG